MIDSIANSLKRKILLSLLLLGVLLAILIFTSLRQGIIPAFETLEYEQSRTTLAQLEEAIDTQFQMLTIYNLEYSSWSDAYESIQQADTFTDFVLQEVFYPEFWAQVRIGMMLFYTLDGQLAWGHIIDPTDPNKQLDLLKDRGVLTKWNPGQALTSSPTGIQGFMQTPRGLMLVTARPALRSDGTGPRVGTVVVGRFLDQNLIDILGKTAAIELQVIPVSDPGLAADDQQLLSRLSDSPSNVLTESTSNTITTRKLISDITGSPLALIVFNKETLMGKIGKESINRTMIVMSLIIALVLWIAWYALGSIIVKPLVLLTAQITEIRRTGDISNIPVKQNKGEIGVLSREVSRLLSELDTVYEELKHTRDQALQMANAKSKFLATMSHEIRTPMNGVLGMAEILHGTSLDSNQQAMVKKIQDSGNHLLFIINDILDFSKIESQKLKLSLEEFDLRKLLEEILDLMAIQASMKNIELVRCLPVTVDQKFIGDPNRIGQILVNLIGNAIKFTDQGNVTVKASIRIQNSTLSNLRVEISDTGVGINKQLQSRIFKEFSQADNSPARQFQGTGLGLAICRALLRLMGGDIDLESEPGKGSSFRFELPLQARQPSLSPSQALDSLQNLHVLIVDAGNPDFDSLQQFLTDYGIVSDRTDDPSGIVAKLKTAYSDGHPFSLVFLDWEMPGINGLDSARVIRAENDSALLPIVLISSPNPEDERLITTEVHIDKYMTTPLRQASLADCLQDLLHSSQNRIKQEDLRDIETKPGLFQADILLIEDNLVNQQVGKTMLEQSGCEVTLAENGAVALAILADRQFDLIFMDCHMPVMDGFEATSLIRENEVATGSHIPIIALTADVIEGVREKCLNAGMDDYITKPFSSLQLQQKLLYWLPDDLTGT